MKPKIENRKLKMVVIVGPTASGKSELAVRLAKKIGGEIISADSRQVYRGLNIGTAKIDGKWQPEPQETRFGTRKVFLYKSIPHHCIDFVSPKRIFTVAEFKECATRAINHIANQGKIPILVGGTGFWVESVAYDLKLPEVPPNPKLRRRLQKKRPAELFNLLKKLDPERAKTVEPHNPRRLIRAIEIAKRLGKVPKLKPDKFMKSDFLNLWIGLNPPKEVLRKNVERRAKKMIRGVDSKLGSGGNKLGFEQNIVTETEKLLRQGVSKKRIKEFGFEYSAALDYIVKTATNKSRKATVIAKKELYKKIVQRSMKYARKQLAWFRRNPNIQWIENGNELIKIIKWLKGRKK